jgi:hypothetical protein
LSAKHIRQAALTLGATSANSLMPQNGNDGIQTPDYLAAQIVSHFMPAGKRLDPCAGAGAFCRAMPNCDWYEITQEKDFLLAVGQWDWIVGNPPR